MPRVQKDMGVSIFSYLNELRMKRAAELLLQRSDRYIKEIAAEVGIDDPFTLHAASRNITACHQRNISSKIINKQQKQQRGQSLLCCFYKVKIVQRFEKCSMESICFQDK